MTQASVTAGIIETANNTLAILAKEAVVNYKDIMRDKLSESQFTASMKALDRALKESGKSAPIGIFPDGIRAASIKTKVSRDDEAAVFALLKQQKRILQCGRGFGKSLIILSDEEVKAVQTYPQNPKKTQREIVDATNDAIMIVSDLRDLLVGYQKENAELTKLIEKKDREIERLRSKSIATWQ